MYTGALASSMSVAFKLPIQHAGRRERGEGGCAPFLYLTLSQGRNERERDTSLYPGERERETQGDLARGGRKVPIARRFPHRRPTLFAPSVVIAIEHVRRIQIVS